MVTRAKKPKKDKGDDFIHLRISLDLKTKLVVIAERSGMDLSNYCRAAMIEKARRDGHEV